MFCDGVNCKGCGQRNCPYPAAAELAPERTPPRLPDVLQMDASGRPVYELLHLAAQYMNQSGGGPLADCLTLKAQEIEALAVAVPETAAQQELLVNKWQKEADRLDTWTYEGTSRDAARVERINTLRACAEQLRARQAEPAPTPSRAEIREQVCDAITGLSFIQDAIFQKNYGTAKEYAEMHEKNLQKLADEMLAEASSLGAKEE